MDALIAALLSGLLFHLSTGLNDVWPLAWLAPVPVLWLAYGGGSARRTALAAFSAFLLGQLHLFEAYAVIGLPLLIMMVVIAAVFAICMLFARFAARRLPPLVAALAFPCAWTGWELLSSLVSPHGSFGALAYSQVSAPVLIQGASLLGLWWVSFLICAVASFTALAIRRPTARIALLAGAGLLFAANLGFGAWRLEQPQGPRVRVAAVADDRLG
jgi:apolipoprotein N-acyltransferase